MATIANEVDKILQAAVTRTTNDPGAALLLAASAQLFKVTAGGNAPNEIVFTATPVALEGNISFSITGGTLTNITAKTATLTFANMSSTTAVVTASLTSGGQTFTAQAFVAKVSDGDAGAAAQLYTWIRFADDINGAGISNDPTSKTHIGFAYNKTSATESNTPGDYAWSLFKGGDGLPGEPGIDGTERWTWVKYSDNPDGTGLYDTPLSTTVYIGIAPNKTTATESTNKADYVWSRMKGEQGVPGPEGSGARGAGAYYVSGSAWSDIVADAATPGGNVVGDRVTIWDNDFVLRKYWDGDSWENDGVVIDGSLIVTGSVTASKIDSRGLIIRAPDGTPLVGIGVPLDASLAAPGTLNADLNIGVGRNRLPNSAPGSLTGYSAAAGSGVTLAGGAQFSNGDVAFTIYAPNRECVFMQAVGTPANGTIADLKANESVGARFTVDAGKRYEASVNLSTHRCASAVGISWYDTAGALIGNSIGSSVSNSAATYTTLPFPRSILFATAPAGARYAVLFARQTHTGSGINPYTFASQWYFGDALEAQTVATQWSEGAASSVRGIGFTGDTDATRGAPAGTLVGGTDASTVAANAAAVTTKLNKNAADTLAGRVALQANGAIVAGDLAFDVNGNRTSGTGSAMNQKGFVHYGPDGTAAVVINAAGVAVKADISGSTGTFGAVVIGSSMTLASGGKFSSGQTAYNTGTGWWWGYVGATPVMSIGVAGGQSLTWDGSELLYSGKLGNTMSLSVTDNISSSRGNPATGATINCGSLTLAITGGRAPFQIQWSIASFSDSPEWGDTHAYLDGADTAIVTLKIKTRSDTSVYVSLTCTVTDDDGKTAQKSFPQNIQFGTPT